MNAPTYSASGTKAAKNLSLPKDVFEVKPESHELLKQAYDAYLANGRVNLAVTKTRGLVRGGGRKPWRQKGTGRARFGSSRNPIWRGGGIVFGPTGQENYTKRLNLKAKRLSLKQALSLSAEANNIVLIEDFKLAKSKTKEITALLSKLKLSGKVVLVTPIGHKELTQASRNLVNVKAISASKLAVFHVLNADHIVFSTEALKAIALRLGGQTND